MKKLLRMFFKAALLAVIVITLIALWPENGDFSAFENIQEQYTDSFVISEEINANPAQGLHVTVPKAATDSSNLSPADFPRNRFSNAVKMSLMSLWMAR